MLRAIAVLLLPMLAAAADLTGQWNFHLVRFGEEFAAARVELKAEGAKQAAILRAEGEARAIDTVFTAIHEGRPDQDLLTYQYLQMLPQIAQGEANKMWIIPSELTQALGRFSDALPRPGDSSDTT